MSLFNKRKGRRITTHEDEDGEQPQGGARPLDADENPSEPIVQPPVRFGKRPLKQSALRRSINVNDEGGLGTDSANDESGSTADDRRRGADKDGGEDEGPVVVRPTIGLGRSGSTRNKKRLSAASSSRLSFGAGLGDDEEDEAAGSTSVSTPKKATAGGGGGASLGQRVLETNAFRSSLSGRLPTRQLERDRDADDEHEHDDRPRYSQAYLEELQSSTPNTPQNLASRNGTSPGRRAAQGGDEMDWDASELEGAMVVDSSELASLQPAAAISAPAAHILTATEIQERKDRRARRALEQGALALGSDDDEENGYLSLLSDRKKDKKEHTRLVREDEDLGEGYDEFVEDSQLTFGRKAEREARRRRKKEMAALIDAAEGPEGDEDGGAGGDESDSEAERLAAYDAAQTRAGMDGLSKQHLNGANGDAGLSAPVALDAVVVPKLRPLPDLTDCLARMRGAVDALAGEAAARRAKLAAAEQEKAEIAAREAEVQTVLDTAGQKYQAVLGAATKVDGKVAAATAAAVGITQSPLRPLPPGLAGEFPAERGLESLGTTPTRRPNPDDVF